MFPPPFRARNVLMELNKTPTPKVGETVAKAGSGRHPLSRQVEPWLLIVDNADDGSLNPRHLFRSSTAR